MHECVATTIIVHVEMCLMWCLETMFLKAAAATCIKTLILGCRKPYNPTAWGYNICFYFYVQAMLCWCNIGALLKRNRRYINSKKIPADSWQTNKIHQTQDPPFQKGRLRHKHSEQAIISHYHVSKGVRHNACTGSSRNDPPKLQSPPMRTIRRIGFWGVVIITLLIGQGNTISKATL